MTTVKKGFVFGAALVALCYLNWANTEEPKTAKVASTFAGAESAAAPSASGSTGGAIASVDTTH